MLGQTIGSWAITGLLGEGGMGAVYAARHTLIGKRAALKVLHPEYSRKREMVKRFFNEARAATSVEHAGIIEIFDYGQLRDGSAYIVMEHLDGEPLSARLRRMHRVGAEEAGRMIRQVATALAAAHARRITHRDLKPDNIFVVPDTEATWGERIKILDFGIAKLAGDGATAPQTRTRTGAVIGTPVYMAPEQCRGAADVDHRADLYAIGCIFYEMLCGRPPFLEAGLGDLLAAHMFEAPVPPRRIAPTVPERTEAIVLRLLAKRPDQRFASCEELVAALEGRIEVEPPPPPSGEADSEGPGEHVETIVPDLAPDTQLDAFAYVSIPPHTPVPDEWLAPVGAVPPPLSAPAGPSTLRGAAAELVHAGTVATRRPLVLLLVVLAAVTTGAVAALIITRDRNDGVAASLVGEAAEDEDADADDGDPWADDPGEADDRGEPAPDLAPVHRAMDTLDWTAAITAADAILSAFPGDPETYLLRNRAVAEQAAEQLYVQFARAVSLDDVAATVRAYERIPDGSIYRTSATPAYQRQRDDYLALKLRDANRSLRRGDCPALDRLNELVVALYPDHAGPFADLARGCVVD